MLVASACATDLYNFLLTNTVYALQCLKVSINVGKIKERGTRTFFKCPSSLMCNTKIQMIKNKCYVIQDNYYAIISAQKFSAFKQNQFPSNLFPICLSNEEADLSEVAPLLMASYMICYTPFVVSEVRKICDCTTLISKAYILDLCSVFSSPLKLILLGKMDLSPAPAWLRTLSSVMSYLDCSLNPLIYCTHQNFREAGLALLWTRSKPDSELVLTAIRKHEL